MNESNFFITGLPRSRTAWFANYFTDSYNFCWHEATNKINTISDYFSRLNQVGIVDYNNIGNSDSGLWLGGYVEGSPLVIIDRDIEDVAYSLLKLDINPNRRALAKARECMFGLASPGEYLHVKYEEIDSCIEAIHHYCVDTPFDSKRAELLMKMRIQPVRPKVDIEATLLWKRYRDKRGEIE